jgi:hypothetical protein
MYRFNFPILLRGVPCENYANLKNPSATQLTDFDQILVKHGDGPKNVTGKLSCVRIKLFGRYGALKFYGMSVPEIDYFYRIF